MPIHIALFTGGYNLMQHCIYIISYHKRIRFRKYHNRVKNTSYFLYDLKFVAIKHRKLQINRSHYAIFKKNKTQQHFQYIFLQKTFFNWSRDSNPLIPGFSGPKKVRDPGIPGSRGPGIGIPSCMAKSFAIYRSLVVQYKLQVASTKLWSFTGWNKIYT